jgi:hypothetical protein
MVAFIILCVVILMIDEAVKKHGDLKKLIEYLKKVEE